MDAVQLEPLPAVPVSLVQHDGAQILAERPSPEETFRAGVLQLGLDQRAAKRRAAAEGAAEAADQPKPPTASPFNAPLNRIRAAQAEVFQLCNLLKLVRGREFFDIHHLTHSPAGAATAPAADSQALRQAVLLETKREHVKDALTLLRSGSRRMREGVDCQRRYLEGLRQVQRRWRLVAPQHGSKLTPLRPGELLAVDASLESAGSTFKPEPTDLSLLYHTACVVGPDEASGELTVLPPPSYEPVTLTVAVEGPAGAGALVVLDAGEGEGEGEGHDALLRQVQHAAWASEVLRALLEEAERSSAQWCGAAGAQGLVPGALAVLRASEEELAVEIDADHALVVRAWPAAAAPEARSDGGWLHVVASGVARALQRRLLAQVRASRTVRAPERGFPPTGRAPVLQPLVAHARAELFRLQVRRELDRLARELGRRRHGSTVFLRTAWQGAAVRLWLGEALVAALALEDGAVLVPNRRLCGPSLSGPHTLRSAAELRELLLHEACREQTRALEREAAAHGRPEVTFATARHPEGGLCASSPSVDLGAGVAAGLTVVEALCAALGELE